MIDFWPAGVELWLWSWTADRCCLCGVSRKFSCFKILLTQHVWVEALSYCPLLTLTDKTSKGGCHAHVKLCYYCEIHLKETLTSLLSFPRPLFAAPGLKQASLRLPPLPKSPLSSNWSTYRSLQRGNTKTIFCPRTNWSLSFVLTHVQLVIFRINLEKEVGILRMKSRFSE